MVGFIFLFTRFQEVSFIILITHEDVFFMVMFTLLKFTYYGMSPQL